MATDQLEKEISFEEISAYMREKSDDNAAAPANNNGMPFDKVREFIDKYFERRLIQASDEQKRKYLHQQHRATKGHPEEMEELKTIIRQQIDELKLQNVRYPSIYRDLADALFHETWGLGVVSVWYEHYGHIGKCRVNGRGVYYKKPGDKRHRMHEQYQEMASVYRLVDNMLRNDEHQVVSREKNHAQIQLFDGTRVTIALPPMFRHPTIIFRRPTVTQYSLGEQAEKNTIFKDAIAVYRMLVRCGTKLMITGEPGTGKTTMLESMFAESDQHAVTVCAENTFEVDLKTKFPDRDISESQGNDKTLVPVVFPITLRMDSQQYIVGEIREVEAPMFKEACSNTRGWVVGTMHEGDSTNVPGTLARKELRHNEGLNYRVSLIDYASKLDYVMVMEVDEDGETLRNVEIAEIRLDPFSLSVTSSRLMWFDGMSWCWNADIDPRLAKRMRKRDRAAFEEGMAVLAELAKANPIPEDEKAITLSWGERT